MIDLKFVRQNPDAFDHSLTIRGMEKSASLILELDEKHRAELTSMQQFQAERNRLAKEFGMLKRDGKDTADNIKQSENLKQALMDAEANAKEYESTLHDILVCLPNILASDVPLGKDESENVVVRTVGTPKRLSFEAKAHFDLGEGLGLMDFERATKLSGARFVALYGPLAKLERALAQFMIDTHTNEFGYLEVYPPYMVLEKTVYGTGLLPKFREDLFATNTGHMLIPTAEVSLTALLGEEIIDKDKLPLRMCAYTPCFRAEAGSAGKDTRGMIRQHQFSKVELVSLTTPEQMDAEHERMTSAAESILQKLGLAYRVLLLCSGDTGFQSQKTYDLEVWLPSQDTYREISSCSKCGDFQTRRLQSRFRGEDGKPALLNSLNGSGLAVGRTLVAILENYQNEDGSITIPGALAPYMDGLTTIKPSPSPFG